MSGRTYFTGYTQVRRLIDYVFDIYSPAGAAVAPVFFQGDTFGASSGVYMNLARLSVGLYTVTTLDPFVGVAATNFQLAAATNAGQLTCTEGPVAVKNSNNTWTFTIGIWNGASPRELAAGDHIRCVLSFENGAGL